MCLRLGAAVALPRSKTQGASRQLAQNCDQSFGRGAAAGIDRQATVVSAEKCPGKTDLQGVGEVHISKLLNPLGRNRSQYTPQVTYAEGMCRPGFNLVSVNFHGTRINAERQAERLPLTA